MRGVGVEVGGHLGEVAGDGGDLGGEEAEGVVGGEAEDHDGDLAFGWLVAGACWGGRDRAVGFGDEGGELGRDCVGEVGVRFVVVGDEESVDDLVEEDQDGGQDEDAGPHGEEGEDSLHEAADEEPRLDGELVTEDEEVVEGVEFVGGVEGGVEEFERHFGVRRCDRENWYWCC